MSDRGPGSAGSSGAAGPSEARRIVEEATRLIDALGGGAAPHTGPECRICPVCRLIATLRDLRPEVVDHLALAAEEILAAVREFASPTATVPRATDPTAAAPTAAGREPRSGPAQAAAPVPATPQTSEPGPADDPGAARASRSAVQHIEITD